MPLYPADPQQGLNNVLIGSVRICVGIAFKAHASSPLAAVRFYEINQNPPNHPGYAGGNGGSYKYEIYDDKNGAPGALVASGYHISGGPPGTNPPVGGVPAPTPTPTPIPSVPPQRIQLFTDANGIPGPVSFSGWAAIGDSAPVPVPVPSPSPSPISQGGVLLDDKQYTEFLNLGGFPLVGFPSFPLLVAGQWYHFVITNIDPDPKTNYISLDVLVGKNGINPDPDSFVEYSDMTGKNWTKYAAMIASPFGAFYANGLKQGNSGYQLAPDGSTLAGTSYGFGGL